MSAVDVNARVHDLRDLRDRFLAVLTKAQEHRPLRTVDAWIVFERTTMWKTVNTERKHRGLAAIDIADVERVERLAVGHSDYSSKFALYCAELVQRG